MPKEAKMRMRNLGKYVATLYVFMNIMNIMDYDEYNGLHEYNGLTRHFYLFSTYVDFLHQGRCSPIFVVHVTVMCESVPAASILLPGKPRAFDT